MYLFCRWKIADYSSKNDLSVLSRTNNTNALILIDEHPMTCGPNCHFIGLANTVHQNVSLQQLIQQLDDTAKAEIFESITLCNQFASYCDEARGSDDS